MKKIYIIFIVLFLLISCGTNDNKQQTNIKNNLQKIELEKFAGKPTILLWGSTGCPNCVKAMPVFEKDIYTKYMDQINIQINTLSEEKFDTNIPQVLNSSLTFQGISSVECLYIPSWIILDKNMNVVLKNCGDEKTLDDIKLTLKDLLIN